MFTHTHTHTHTHIYIYIYIYSVKLLSESRKLPLVGFDLKNCQISINQFIFQKTSCQTAVALLFLIIFTNPSTRAGYDIRSIFKRSLTGFNSEFSFSYTSCLTKAEELSLPYYLPIAVERII